MCCVRRHGAFVCECRAWQGSQGWSRWMQCGDGAGGRLPCATCFCGGGNNTQPPGACTCCTTHPPEQYYTCGVPRVAAPWQITSVMSWLLWGPWRQRQLASAPALQAAASRHLPCTGTVSPTCLAACGTFVHSKTTSGNAALRGGRAFHSGAWGGLLARPVPPTRGGRCASPSSTAFALRTARDFRPTAVAPLS